MFIELALLGSAFALWKQPSKKSKTAVQSATPSFFQRAKQTSVQVKKALWGQSQQQLHLSLDPTQAAELARQQRIQKRELLVSSGALGMIAFGLFVPSYYVIGCAGALLLARDTLLFVWDEFKQSQFITVYSVNVFVYLCMLATGHLFLTTFSITFSNFLVKLIQRTEANAQQHLINVFGEQPSHVWVEKDGIELEIPFESLQKGDVVVVHAGETIPVDGIIQSGIGNIDQHLLTGESQPIEKTVGDEVFAATLILSGRIHIEVTTAGEETVAAKVGHILNHTTNYKDTLTLRGKKIADNLLPVELAASGLALGIGGFVPAMAVLWSGLGYRMIVYSPITVLNYLQILSQHGILVKDGRIFESLQQVDTVVFDKTGTLTLEQPTVAHIHLLADYDEHTVLSYAAGAEYRQSHPIAKAILKKATTEGVTQFAPDSTCYEVGQGIKVEFAQHTVCVGSARFMTREAISLPATIESIQQHAEQYGHSLVYVAIDAEVAAVLELQPTIRPEARQLIKQLKQRKLTTYIISGDHEQPTRSIAQQLGIDHYFADTLPEHKAELVQQLRDQGKFVCFIGDGINDAIALKTAQVSISLKGATSAATDTAQIVFMNGNLTSFYPLLVLSDEFEASMQNNFLLSVVPGVVNIAGVFFLHFSLLNSMELFYFSSALGLVNTLRPLIKHPHPNGSQLLQLPAPEVKND